ncbi:MAG: flagellar protein FlgN [Synergistaceae bacterium]|nr:flagellar protein FlgN [Synergistaceae bacterium]
MPEKSDILVETLAKQDEILCELLSVTQKQREALKDGRMPDLQDLMSEMRHISVRAQAIETKRERMVSEFAAEIGCEPVVSGIIRALSPDEAGRMDEASRKLISTVERLKVEMSILARLMDEAKNLNEVLISEWRKMSMRMAGASAGFDTRI